MQVRMRRLSASDERKMKLGELWGGCAAYCVASSMRSERFELETLVGGRFRVGRGSSVSLRYDEVSQNSSRIMKRSMNASRTEVKFRARLKVS